MNRSLLNAETMELLSRITGQELEPESVDLLLPFLASLVTVLLGVIMIDRTIAETEKQRLQQILLPFVEQDPHSHTSIQHLINEVQRLQLYIIPEELLKLTAPLSTAEKMLLIGLGYEMAAADGTVDLRESLYLEAIANRLALDPKPVTVLATCFSQTQPLEPTELVALKPFLARDFKLPILTTVAHKLWRAIATSAPQSETLSEDQSIAY